MLVDATVEPSLPDAAQAAATAERIAYDGLWVAEVASDPFLPLTVAAEHSARLTLGTNIAVAFARNPMNLAMVANDLQAFSGGRFVLGLGSQIRPHITKRFSMPWSDPAARMREMIEAVRAIWATWNDGQPLQFRGQYYTHTLMTPMFSPPPNPHGPPPIYLAAVGRLMTRTAAEVADGILLHPFSTERYLREVSLPAVTAALDAAGRDRSRFTVCAPVFPVVDEASAAATRAQLAFYGSTPAYEPVLALHGWSDLHRDLNRLSKQGRWQEMTELVDDEVLSAFGVVADAAQLPARVRERFGDVDRVSLPMGAGADVERWGPIVEALRG